jgi:GGDEF domain-containing protein
VENDLPEQPVALRSDLRAVLAALPPFAGLDDRILQAIAAEVDWLSLPVTVTASCGITTFLSEDAPDGVFDRADRALYRAKEAGRNSCVVG